MGQLWSFKCIEGAFSDPQLINPVRYICSNCGWASFTMRIICSRCGQQFTEWRSMVKPTLKSISSTTKANETEEKERSMVRPRLKSLSSTTKTNTTEEKETPKKKGVVLKRLTGSERRSRCLSRSFFTKFGSPLGVKVPAPLMENDISSPFTTELLIGKIVKIMENKRPEDDENVFLEISHLLRREKAKGTPWKQIADETIIEFITLDLNVSIFARALISAYGVSAYSIGKFIATPPNFQTLSLIEEAICQDSLCLFEELLLLDNVMRGLLECQELSDEDVRNLLQ